jgi:glutamate N-acetyltransferase/amino-acid N-acetyltransferase
VTAPASGAPTTGAPTTGAPTTGVPATGVPTTGAPDGGVTWVLDTDAGVTAARGFLAAGVAAGIKSSGAPDLAVVVNTGPLDAAAGVFTRNKVVAAPVLWTRQVLAGRRLRAAVLNSGGANACTGPAGFADTHATAERAAAALGAGARAVDARAVDARAVDARAVNVGAVDVAVCSTGLIGQRLPLPAVLAGVTAAVAGLAGTPEAGLAAATAVLTTDTVPKQAAVRHPGGWTAGGFAKGAGMLAPSLATMLAVLTTDAVAGGAELDAALRAATRVTFDRLDVDGSCSTNDTVLLLASGASGHRPTPAELSAAVTELCAELARQLQADAEGVTKRVAVTAHGASTEDDAVAVARAVARDSLVKTALFGCDPNWGRIAAAAGMAEAELDPDRLDIAINGVTLCRGGAAAAARGTADQTGPDIAVHVGLNLGTAQATIRTTDLSHGYVEENSAYPS